MHRISPRVLGILVVAGGICAALPFQQSASHRVPRQRTANSDSIQWRSNDFTLEVVATDQPLTGSPHADDRSKSPAFGSPAFGGADGVIVNSRASLENATQPPALAGTYEPESEVTTGDTTNPATMPPKSVAITHEISDGDTLEALAEKHLGSRLRWTEIYNANPEILDNPEVLPVGVTIVILPSVQPSASNSSNDTESLVPVSESDLLRFRESID